MDLEKYNDHISQGISLMGAENYTAAKTEFEKAIQINIKSYDAYIHLGNACANMGLYDEALAAFKKALVVDPASGAALYSVGNIHLLQDEKLKAVEYYNKAEQAGFERAEMYQILAGIYFEANDSTQALRNITKAIAFAPFDGELRIFKTRIYLADEKYEEAIETLEEMQKVIPDAFEAYDLRTQIYCGIGKQAEALKICELGCSKFPDDAKLKLLKLRVLVEMSRDNEALELIADMKEKDQYSMVIKSAAIQHSIILLRRNDVEGAVKTLLEADDAVGGDADLLYLVLDIYGKTENYEKVIEFSQKLISMKTDVFYDSTAKYFYAYSLDKLGREEEAQAEYRKLTSALRKATIETPAFYEGYIYRLLSHTRLGEFERALELADYMENLYPEKADAYAFRHFIYKEQGDIAKAEEQRKLALEKNPTMQI